MSDKRKQKKPIISLNNGCLTLNFLDDDLPNYIMIMMANRKTKKEMTEALTLFLNDRTEEFTTWLYQMLDNIRKRREKQKETEEKKNEKAKENNNEKEEIKGKLRNNILEIKGKTRNLASYNVIVTSWLFSSFMNLLT